MDGVLVVFQDYAPVFSLIAVVFAAVVLILHWKSIKEMVATQRAQTGPLLELSFELESYDPSLIDPPRTNLDFLPIQKGVAENYIIGELFKDASNEKSAVEHKRLVVHIKNIQEHFSGFASDVEIELIGSWFLSSDAERQKPRSHFIHLKCSVDVLKPGEYRRLNAPGIGEVSVYRVEVRRLKYRDIWGHLCNVFSGSKGCSHWGFLGGPEIVTWESVVSDKARETSDFPDKWFYRKKLIKERLRLFRKRGSGISCQFHRR